MLQERRYARLKEEEERKTLLARKFTTNDHQTNIFIDHELKHHSKLQVKFSLVRFLSD